MATGASSPSSPAPTASNDVAITLDGKTRLAGWQRIHIELSCEAVPSRFELEVTERDPGDATTVSVIPGQSCVVTFGADPVVTGYVDRYEADVEPHRHAIRILGRGKVQDMVDCSALLDNMQLTRGNLLALATRLAQPYGISVVSLGDVGNAGQVPPINVSVGQTPYEIIELIARTNGVLVYEDASGNLVLAHAGATQMASGFAQGKNVQAAQVQFSMDERYSEYVPLPFDFQRMSDFGTTGFPYGVVKDAGVTRFRQLAVVSELSQNGQSFALQCAQWEAARRAGRSQAIRVVCDSWRDERGNLWRPNATAYIDMPACKVDKQNWVIGSVSFERDADRGTTATLLLMPPTAFTPQPALLQPFYADFRNDNAPTGGASPGAGPAPGTGQPPQQPTAP